LTEQSEAWILQFESGRNWINKLPSEDTRRVFIRNLQKYCDAVSKNPDELIALKIEGLKAVATEKEFQAERLLENHLSNCGLTVSAKEMMKNAIISFYKHNWRNLNPNVASDIQKPEPKKRCPKMDDILSLENAMTNQRDKAIVWFFASTSVRIGTLIKLKWNDLKATNDSEIPFYIEIESSRLKGAGKGKYKGLKQVTFLHKLAVAKLENYKAEAKRKGYLLEDDSPIFIGYKNKKRTLPITAPSINSAFDNASLSIWHDLELRRFSPHDFRDFVQSGLENAGINSNLINPILAHKVKGIDFHYSEHDINDLLQKFKTALPFLLPTVESVKIELETTKSEYEKKIEELETEFVEKLMLQSKTLMQYISKALEKGGIKTTIEESGEEP
jgi:integrase